jgi:4-nitrophenyl phosphatase
MQAIGDWNMELEFCELPVPPRAVLFDLDGTLYRGDRALPGAPELVHRLEARGVACWFVTNNSTRTPQEVADHMRRLGFAAKPERIVTSAQAAALYIAERHPGGKAYVIGERGLQEAVRDAGIPVAREGERADIVVQGLDRSLTYDRLCRAVQLLLDGAAFVQTNPDRLLPVETGYLPGAGSIGAALREATGIAPTVVGKPESFLMETALRLAGVDSSAAWVVGDNPHTDIAAGLNAGCPTILILTGYCSERDWREQCAAAGVRPHAVCRDAAALWRLYAACADLP